MKWSEFVMRNKIEVLFSVVCIASGMIYCVTEMEIFEYIFLGILVGFAGLAILSMLRNPFKIEGTK